MIKVKQTPLPTLQDKNLKLRTLVEDDAYGAYPSWLNNKEVTKYNSHGATHYTKEMALQYIKGVNDSNSIYAFAIELDGEHIGNISLQNVNSKDENAEFAILIGRDDMYGKNIGFRASKLLLEFGFNVLKLHRIYCGTSEFNNGMQKLALKLGFKQESVKKDAMKKDAIFIDIFEYGILNEIS